MSKKIDIIKERLRRFRLSKKETKELITWIHSYWYDHWTEEDSPETEFKMRTSF